MDDKEREAVKEAMCKAIEKTGTFEGRAIAAHARASGLPACFVADQFALATHGMDHRILVCTFTIRAEADGQSSISMMPPPNLEMEAVQEVMKHVVEYAQKIVDGVKPAVEIRREAMKA